MHSVVCTFWPAPLVTLAGSLGIGLVRQAGIITHVTTHVTIDVTTHVTYWTTR